jgi:hypothetical protein
MSELPKAGLKNRFGILFRESAKSLGSFTVIEFFDGEKSIKKVSLDEYYGKESASWKKVATESQISKERIVTVFNVKQAKYDFNVVREIVLNDDPRVASGKYFVLDFSVRSKTPLKIKTKFYGKAKGIVVTSANAFSIVAADTLQKLNPALVFSINPGATIKVETAKKGKTVPFIITAPDAEIGGEQPIRVLGFTIYGTTVGFQPHIRKQAEVLEGFTISKREAPSLGVCPTNRF